MRLQYKFANTDWEVDEISPNFYNFFGLLGKESIG